MSSIFTTVPTHRKVNRVDLGTADKLCAAAAAIDDQARRLGIRHRETSFVLAELGGAFSAVLTVAGGEIVSGQGGSSGPLGYRACGAMDGEVACLLRAVTKETVFSGGVAFVAGAPSAPPEALPSPPEGAWRIALDAFCEGLVKAVAGELAVAPRAAEVLVSGRLTGVPAFYEAIVAALGRLRPVRRLRRVRHGEGGRARCRDDRRRPLRAVRYRGARRDDALEGGARAPSSTSSTWPAPTRCASGHSARHAS